MLCNMEDREERLTHQILGVNFEKYDYSNNTRYTDTVSVNKHTSKSWNALGEVTYKAPRVNEIANPIFFEVDICSLHMIGSGKKRTVTKVTVLVTLHAK